MTLASSHAAAGDRPSGRDESLGRGVLEDEPGGAGVESARQRAVVVERGQDEDRWRIPGVDERLNGGHAVDPAHPDVHQDEIDDGR